MVKKKLLTSFFFSLLFFLSLPKYVFAANFSSSYDVFYEIKEDGTTFVRKKIRLTNLTSHYFISQYLLNFEIGDIKDIKVWSENEQPQVDIKKEGGLTKIYIKFNKKIVSKGKFFYLDLSFQTQEIAQHIGKIWEINIPKVRLEEEVNSYNISLNIPKSFGDPAYVLPKPSKPFYWSKEDGSMEGITLGFGDWQGYKFKFSLSLKNDSFLPALKTIILPPDTSYQKVFFEKISPQFRKIDLDKDGNYLAYYFLLPKQKIEIQIEGFLQVFLTPRKDFPLDEENLEIFLHEDKYWKQNQEILKLAKELKTPKAIYDFVVANLTYDYERASSQPKRFGADLALKNKDKAICMEFTDLFIAIARAAGIPAREIDGYIFTSRSNAMPIFQAKTILHSWPEYFDKERKLWVQIDPTWAKTSNLNFFDRFDFNHITLVKKGFSSTKPDFYQNNNREIKNILIEPINISSEVLGNYIPPAVELKIPKHYLAGLPFWGILVIKNMGNNALFNLGFILNSSFLNFSPTEIKLKSLLFNEEKNLKISFDNSDPFLFKENTFKVFLNNKTLEVKTMIYPIFIIFLPLLIISFISIIIFKKIR